MYQLPPTILKLLKNSQAKSNKTPKLLDTIETTVDPTNKSQKDTLLTEEVEPVERIFFIFNFLVTDQEKKEEEEETSVTLKTILKKKNIKNLNNKSQLLLKKPQLNKLSLKNLKN